VIVLIVALSAAGHWKLRSTVQPGDRPLPAPETASAHPADRMTGEEAYNAASRHSERGEWLQSLPYYARAAALRSPPAWDLHTDLGTALHNASVQPGVRSSFERVTLTLQAMAEIDRADTLATAPAERLQVLIARARLLRYWGLPWDALVATREAQRSDPGSPLAATTVSDYEHLLREPAPPGRPQARALRLRAGPARW